MVLQQRRIFLLAVTSLWIMMLVYCGGKYHYVVKENRMSNVNAVSMESKCLQPGSHPHASNSSRRQLKLTKSTTAGTFNMTRTMSVEEADHIYYASLRHLDYKCEDYVQLGDIIDGGYGACVVEPYRFQRPCLVYSFGINYDFSFDDAVSIKFGCTVRSFDPSMNVTDHQRDDNILFYRLGLGWSDRTLRNGWKTMKLQSIVDILGDSEKIIDFLKIDVEDDEWSALRVALGSDVLERVKQLAIEVHVMPPGAASTKIFFTRWRTLTRLQLRGFRKWAWHFNPAGGYEFHGKIRSCCYELVYINENFLQRTFRDGRVAAANTSAEINDE